MAISRFCEVSMNLHQASLTQHNFSNNSDYFWRIMLTDYAL